MRLREAGIFEIWAQILKIPISNITGNAAENEIEELLLEAKRMILTSLTNFYYDSVRSVIELHFEENSKAYCVWEKKLTKKYLLTKYFDVRL